MINKNKKKSDEIIKAADLIATNNNILLIQKAAK